MSDEISRVVALYSPPLDFVLPADFKLESYQGLERIQVTRSGASRHIVTTWRKSDAIADETLRLGKAGLGSFVWLETVTKDRSVARESFFQKYMRPAVLIPTILAIGGGVETMRNHYAGLLAGADFAVAPAISEPSALANTPAEIEFQLVNRAPAGGCTTRVVQAVIDPIPPQTATTAVPVGLSTPVANWRERFAPGKMVTETLLLPGLPAGRYQLSVRHEAKSGFFRFRETEVTTTQIRVWPAWDLETGDIHLDNPEATRCDFWYTLKVGAALPRGAILKISLQPADPTTIAIAAFDDNSLPGAESGPPRTAGTGANSVVVQKITLPAIGAFKTHRFWIRLAGPKKPAEEWRKLFSQLTPHIKLERL